MLLPTLVGSVVVQDGYGLVTEVYSRPLMACPIPMVLAPLLSHKPVLRCQHLTHILSSCSDTTFAQAISYCIAGNGTLVCTDRYGGGLFCGHCLFSLVLNTDVNVFDSSCYAPTGCASLFQDISCNVT